MADQGAGSVTYYRIMDGGNVARETDGWNREVFLPQHGEWRDAVELDINFAVEAQEITEQEAQAALSEATGFGEFGPEAPEEESAAS